MDVLSTYYALRVWTILAPAALGMILLLANIPLFRPDIIDRENRIKSIPPSEIKDSYHFIIIGGGSAGSTLAHRLTEDRNTTVLLLEAGNDEPPVTDVPFMYEVILNTPIDWQFKTEPTNKSCLAEKNHQIVWSRGKALGGSSVINGLMYSRGNRKDYDYWAEQGNPGWDHESIFKYFKKFEDMRIDEFKGSPYHSTGGPLTIEHYRYRTPITDYLLKAGTEIGYDILDYNGAKQTGFAPSQATLRDGLRCSTAKAYIRSASKRENLHVSLQSYAEKILVREEGGKKIAYGVQFRVDGALKEVKADREIILSAGAIQSPQLLMLSGIGPKEHLEEVGVPVVHDLPGVGQHLMDHVAMGDLTYLVDPPEDYNGFQPFTFIVPENINPTTALEFNVQHKGPFYSLATAESLAFINTKYANASEDYPDIQFFISAFFDYSHSCLDGLSHAENKFYGEWCSSMFNRHSYWIKPVIMRPKSRGYIKLRSKDPNDHPIIDPNYFDDPHDIDVLIEGAKIVHQLSETPTMKKLNARAHINPVDECSSFEFMSDDFLRCHARYHTMTYNHASGTCKMGPANDTMAVVDSRLRLYGVSRLRVIDTSIMPRLTTGNTNAPTVMIAEKGADMIKEDWGIKN
ncbi:glucose dehydrogenase [FAD, quinone]-like [Hylaeus volcanicus]|uniref:glucose dehydrogenase [FAD, quinone]-like n=1 Tax=Hylaeus volcanicus TaxID=313075 RepID=UPI0023B8297F|nr:glucose dehydrogenase [FAD, quinone]-like [Hylaeus volcanicus]XP_053995173.1 glucose dehydrogenase [FAD, quinone]-like [Hylaeus volcanicus]